MPCLGLLGGVLAVDRLQVGHTAPNSVSGCQMGVRHLSDTQNEADLHNVMCISELREGLGEDGLETVSDRVSDTQPDCYSGQIEVLPHSSQRR